MFLSNKCKAFRTLAVQDFLVTNNPYFAIKSNKFIFEWNGYVFNTEKYKIVNKKLVIYDDEDTYHNLIEEFSDIKIVHIYSEDSHNIILLSDNQIDVSELCGSSWDIVTTGNYTFGPVSKIITDDIVTESWKINNIFETHTRGTSEGVYFYVRRCYDGQREVSELYDKDQLVKQVTIITVFREVYYHVISPNVNLSFSRQVGKKDIKMVSSSMVENMRVPDDAKVTITTNYPCHKFRLEFDDKIYFV